jgi:hypothetical protein
MICCRSCPSVVRCELAGTTADLHGHYCLAYAGTNKTRLAEAQLYFLEEFGISPKPWLIDAFNTQQARDYERARREHDKRRAGQEAKASPDKVKP